MNGEDVQNDGATRSGRSTPRSARSLRMPVPGVPRLVRAGPGGGELETTLAHCPDTLGLSGAAGHAEPAEYQMVAASQSERPSGAGGAAMLQRIRSSSKRKPEVKQCKELRVI